MDKYKSKLAELLKQGEELIVIRLLAKGTDDELVQDTADVFQSVAPDKVETTELFGLGSYVVIKP
ncbi:hypothetical protein [Paenibacillus donghaensis]|uniref:Uncharacterized protein n=1 Tax=Paenibacillus donghaensis TaxID=414771 RepID=A0A2Z2KAW7_9BACL|nr:hypothetical protein [Paenibacillus donghaensis]ASA20080.1 hypothetical protein B9T62_04285 [Paenibacillus donghaensis]